MRWFFDYIIVFKIQDVELWLLLAYSESEQDFSTTYEDFIGSIFQPSEMASYIRAVKAQNAIKILACLTEKFQCAYSPNALMS